MNYQFEKHEFQGSDDERLSKDLSKQIHSLLSNYETNTVNDFVFESSAFKDLCTKAKNSYEAANDRPDREKLILMVAIFVVRSGLFVLLEKAYSKGHNFEDL